MLKDGAPHAHKVAIVIFTYKRNEALLRLIAQCRGFLGSYRGHNRYELCVSDSDRMNPIASRVSELGVKYSVNPATGFDDNVYHFWQNNIEKYDFIFSFSDDDMFAPWLHPLYLLDAAMESGHQAGMFNHRYFTRDASGNVDLGRLNFPETKLVYDKSYLLLRVLRNPPSHVGLLYSTKLLKVTLTKAREFRGTLHLYAVPAILAAASNTLLYSEHVLCLFQRACKGDGAWNVSEDVLNGLVLFLKKLKQLFPPELYQVAEAGYFAEFFGTDCWLRGELGSSSTLKSEEQIREMLAAA